MQERLLSLMKKIIPELSELEANGYLIDGVLRGTCSFDIEARKEGEQTISLGGLYKTNGGVTSIKFERFIGDIESGEGLSETADYTITRINNRYCLFEEVWRDIDDEAIRQQAHIVKNDDETIKMPYVGSVVVANFHKTKSYKTYKKFNDKNVLSAYVRSHLEDKNTSEW